MLLFYIVATLFGGFVGQSSIYVGSATVTASEGKAAVAGKTSMPGLLSYPLADSSTYMNAAGSSGSFSEEYNNDGNVRAPTYDPGDALLRALNDELAANKQELGVLPEEPDYADTVFNELEVASKYEMLRRLENDLREEQEVVSKAGLLMKLLADPTIETLPVVYVEDASAEYDVDEEPLYRSKVSGQMTKRSRYYRRYPWKRHNRNRSTYEPELRYACTPSKEDVFKLLVNLHENRKGNHGKTVNFCNRKRPAKAVFTNIRFLG